jgi:NAD(P)-dependent dehydrogenase (short-subunit alcohol dehydrogenase family)
MEIAGKVAVVTGAAGGIGEAVARAFHALGVKGLTLVDIDQARLDVVAESLGAHAVVADLGQQSEVERVVAETEERFGPVDVFFSNAGILTMGGAEVATEDWQNIWDINVMAHIHAARAVLPSMIERGDGYLLSTASAAGLLSQIGSAPYSVTKAAAVSFAEWLSITHGEQGIKVSVLCPQAVATPMTEGVEGGGVAGTDGLISAEFVADCVVQAMRDEKFLILPHPEVAKYAERKGADRQRWIGGMRRLQAMFPGGGVES